MKQLEYFKKLDENFITLLVEDNDDIRVKTEIMFKNILPNIITAKDGEEGITLFNKHKYSKNLRDFDLIISDIQMPKKDGLNMLSEIKVISKNIPVIIISAYSKTEYFLEAISIGVDNYVLKPYTIENITNILFNTLTKYNNDEVENTVKPDNINQLVSIGNDYFYDKFDKFLLYKDKPIKTSKNEISLLEILIKLKGERVSCQTIEYYIWEESVDKSSLRALIYRLRSKTYSDIIETVSSFGYRLKYYNDEK